MRVAPIGRLLFCALVAACGLDVAGVGGGEGSASDASELDASVVGDDANTIDSDSGNGVDIVVDASPIIDAGAIDTGTFDAGVDAGPVVIPDFAWYRLNETNGNTAKDSTSNGYDITNLTNVTWSSGAIFNGTNSQGSRQVAASFRQPPISITAWLAPVARSDRNANQFAILPFPPNAISGDIPGSFGYGIGLNVWTDGAAGSALSVEGVDYALTYNGAPFLANTEYFVAAAIGPTTATIYVNGVNIGTRTAGTPGPAAPAVLRIGAHNTDTGYQSKRFYKGRIRDVRIYKRVLTADEVTQLYSAGPAM